jgi:hypothetical protein
MLFVGSVTWAVAASSPSEKDDAKPKTPKDRATDFCRKEAGSRLKYAKTVKWTDLAKEEKSGTWLISGLRTAGSGSGEVDQQYTCRVQINGQTTSLKMIQIFKEASKTGEDIFETK